MKKGPENYPFLPGIGPEDDTSGGIKTAEAKSEENNRPFEHLVENCPVCGDEKGSNPDTCRSCAHYVRKNPK